MMSQDCCDSLSATTNVRCDWELCVELVVISPDGPGRFSLLVEADPTPLEAMALPRFSVLYDGTFREAAAALLKHATAREPAWADGGVWLVPGEAYQERSSEGGTLAVILPYGALLDRGSCRIPPAFSWVDLVDNQLSREQKEVVQCLADLL